MNNVKKLLGFAVVFMVVMVASMVTYAAGTDVWTDAGSMSTVRSWHNVAAINGKIYSIGGQDESGVALSSVEEYNPTTKTWVTKASLNTARCYHSIAVLNDKIYVIGGSDGVNNISALEEYDPTTNIWTTKAPMPTARHMAEIAIVNGKIYAIGGAQGTGKFTNAVEEYDPTTNMWTTKAPMPTARYYNRVAVVNNKIYAIGGYNNNALNVVEEYDPLTNTWKTKASMSEARVFHQVAEINGKIYAIGGNLSPTNSVEMYDPSTNVWTKKASMNIARNEHKVVVMNRKIYVVGGKGDTAGVANALEEYDPELDTWITKGAMANSRVYHQAIGVNGKIYAIGGSGLKSTEVYNVNPSVTLEVTSVDKTKVGNEITANVVIHNAANICAEDIKLAFDTEKLQFVSAEGADGIKVYKESDIATGIKRYITASLGKANAANGDKILLKIKLKAIAKGEAKIDITKGRIADNATLEMDVEDNNCGEKTVLIEGVKDVNRSGEYTLLDLGIDAWYYGDAASATDTSKYDADQVENGTIDDADLSQIVNEMLNNTNYPANK